MTCWPGAEDHCIQSLHVFHPARPHNPGHCIILTSILLHTILNPPAYYTQLSCILYSTCTTNCIPYPYFTNRMLNTAFYTLTVYIVHTAYFTQSHIPHSYYVHTAYYTSSCIHGTQTLLRATDTDANLRI